MAPIRRRPRCGLSRGNLGVAQICIRPGCRSHSGPCTGVEKRRIPDRGLGVDGVRARLRPASVPTRVPDCRALTTDLTSSIPGPKVDMLTERPPASCCEPPAFFVADCLPRKSTWVGDQGVHCASCSKPAQVARAPTRRSVSGSARLTPGEMPALRRQGSLARKYLLRFA
jgi:hypothetical protein